MTATKTGRRATFSDELRDAIQESGLTAYALGKRAEVDPGIIARFMAEDRGLTNQSIDKIAGALGLHLATATRAKGRPRKTASRAG